VEIIAYALCSVSRKGLLAMSFGRNLQTLREKAGLSQSELAARAEISVKSIQNWEIDRYQPRMDAILKLASALGVELEALMKPVAQSKPRGRRKRDGQ
jgi:transcriptional regulator with XRE-family HTH domain